MEKLTGYCSVAEVRSGFLVQYHVMQFMMTGIHTKMEKKCICQQVLLKPLVTL